MENLITYKINSDSTADLFFNDIKMTTVDVTMVEVDFFVDAVNEFIDDFTAGGNIVEVKSGDGELGLIVDIWQDSRYDDIVESATFWFDDFALV